MKYAYLGTDWFSAEVLKRLIKEYRSPAVVITQKPKPRGRGLKLYPSEVEEVASDDRIPVIGISSFEELRGKTGEFNSIDAIVVCSFGLYIPSWFTALFSKGTFNFHPSLLPRYRGAAPIQRSLMNGDDITGVSIIEVSEEMDAGQIYDQVTVNIDIYDSYETLSRKLIDAGVPVLIDVLRKAEEGKLSAFPQKGEPTYAPKIGKGEQWIDWNKSALEIHNKIRALSPRPGARTILRGSQLKILETRPYADAETELEPGTVASTAGDSFMVATGKGLLEIFRVQPENRRVMTSSDFINGYRLKIGEILHSL
jgi:methionyl-tRNA formyltransferase